MRIATAVALCVLLLNPVLGGEPPAPFAPGTILLIRHALAPGTGDPAGFDPDDCSTQRNLDDTGRAQARALGQRLRAAGLGAETPVFTSLWCRCQETARLLGLGTPRVHPGLASFYEDHVDRDKTLAELARLLSSLPVDGPPVVLVTHQVNITAVTGRFPGSAEVFVLRADGTDRPAFIDRLPPPRVSP